jgi:hypothetical protein
MPSRLGRDLIETKPADHSAGFFLSICITWHNATLCGMAKNVRISDNLYTLAQLESRLENRSIAQQLEYWAKLGMVAASGRSTTSALATVTATLELTRRLDALDVRNGVHEPNYFHFIPDSVARQSTVTYPRAYRKI